MSEAQLYALKPDKCINTCAEFILGGKISVKCHYNMVRFITILHCDGSAIVMPYCGIDLGQHYFR